MIESPTLLITDDDQAFRETLRDVFAPRGFATMMASDGSETLEIVRHHSVHLLLVDMHMPRLTGLDTIRQLRAAAVQTPCILMSARLDPQTVAAAQHEGVFSVLSKPFSIRTLTALVAEALARVYHWPAPPA
jgi:two-component system chemotaxis response regulator CheY